MDIVVDAETPINSKLCAKYKRSFAYPTVTHRLPVIVTGIIDRLVRDKNVLNEDSKEESKEVIGELAELKYMLQTAKPLTKFSSNDADTDMWNSYIDKYTAELSSDDKLTFYNGPWLFVECYLYRQIREIFVTSSSLKQYDAFSDKKEEVLRKSLPAIEPYFKHLMDQNILDTKPMKTTDLINEFTQLFKLVLWANRVDLSLSSGNTDECHDPVLNLDSWNDNILSNDTEKLMDIIFSPSSGSDQERVIDYVVDNSGIELLTDLCLCDFLITRCGIDKIRLRCKRMPWFVSDVTVRDFKHTLDTMSADGQTKLSQFFANRWSQFLEKGAWILTEDVFWTLGLSYNDMPDEDPKLYSELSKSTLIIFKGDLNYRKLVQDTNWEPGTSFTQALGNFRPAPLVAIRTSKADTIAGIQPDVFNSTAKKSPDWLISGEYGVIQFDSPQ